MISIEQKVKFILYGFAFFFTLWGASVYLNVADKEDLSSFIVYTAQGLWTAALILFDVKKADSQVAEPPKPQAPLNGQD